MILEHILGICIYEINLLRCWLMETNVVRPRTLLSLDIEQGILDMVF